MGVDWIRMRPRAGGTVFAEAVRRQALAFAASGCWSSEEFGHLDMPEPVTDEPGMAALIDIDKRPGNTHRVNAFVYTPLLPAEWRFAAYSSFLPDELGRRVRQWRAHIAEVRAGGHRAYSRAWHAYSTSRRLAGQWAELRCLAAEAGRRTNAWAVRPELIDVRERILARTPPAVSPAPKWGRPPEVRDVDGLPFVELAREWNRRVPGGQKVYVALPPSLEEFLDDPGPDDTLRWMDEAAEDGYGLVLDW